MSSSQTPVVTEQQAAAIKQFVLDLEIKDERLQRERDAVWDALAQAGTEAWLDTGDIDAAAALWTGSFTALTTNNTLLNKEVQKGIYDSLVGKANQLLESIGVSDEQLRVREIAFILNAHHGLRLVAKFGVKVSVELHTDVINDKDATIHYGRRFIAICPENFIVKIPLSPSGILACRVLRDEGVPVNFTLGFSARQNYIITALGRPTYCNVFLGRLNSYVIDNKLGDGKMVGEKATIASNNGIRQAGRFNPEPTRQIAASIREAANIDALAGVDVHTIPTPAAEAFHRSFKGPFTNKLNENYEVGINADAVARFRFNVAWDLSEDFTSAVDKLAERLPTTGDELASWVREHGFGDLFPEWTADDIHFISTEGKIPKHERWAERLEQGKVGWDALMTAAASLSFTVDEAALDNRIKSHL